MRKKHVAMLGFSLVLASGYTSAEVSDEDDGWKFGVEIYGWAAAIEAESSSGVEVDVPFEDTLDKLESGFMGMLGARKGNWTLMSDILYLKIGGDAEVSVPNVRKRSIDGDASLEAWVANYVVGYRVAETDKYELNLAAGARYISIDVSADIKVNSASFFDGSFDAHAWDGIVGVMGKYRFNNKWAMLGYTDVGAGDSKLTHQTLLSISYKFDKLDGVLGYRYLSWDLDNEDVTGRSIDTVRLAGPYIGIKYPL